MAPRPPFELPPPRAAATTLDVRKLGRAFARASAAYDSADFLQSAVRERLLERLDELALAPRRALDLGAGTGAVAQALALRFPQAEVLAVDRVRAMAGQAAGRPGLAGSLCADAARLPLADGSVDLVLSNLMLHWCPSIPAVFAEIARVLSGQGAVTLTTLGPASFRELKSAWAAVDPEIHVHDFPALGALGDGLLAAGLAEPVVDREVLTITYADLRQLTLDLQRTGTTNAHPGRSRGLTGRRSWARLRDAYGRHADASGRLPVTLEVLYLQAWGRQGARAPGRDPGIFEVPLTDLGRRGGS